MNKAVSWLNNLSAISRLIFCLFSGLVLFGILMADHFEMLTTIMLSWDTFSLTLILLSWITFFTVPISQLKDESRQQDESRSVIFVIISGIICISLVGVLLLMRTTNESILSKELHRVIALLGVALSWVLLHTLFTLRYAHLYYAADSEDLKLNRGLDFPEAEAPGYLDFAYFSFVVGMTFQVSDVTVNTKQVRKVVLVHGLISFIFNTAIVALTISVVSNLGH